MTNELEKILHSEDFVSADSICDVNWCTIYHYTSPDGLLSILSPGGKAKLWFTRYDSLNDANERKDILSYLDGYCKFQVRYGKISKVFAEMLMSVELSDNHDFTYPGKYPVVSEMFGEYDSWINSKIVPCDTYLCCFSEEADLLPMWNYYTRAQHYEGYSVGFNCPFLAGNAGFEQGYSLKFKRVIYLDSEKANLLDRILLPLNDIYTNGSTEDKNIITSVLYEKINELQFVFKNTCFQHEKEIRAILRIPHERLPDCMPFEVKYRNSNGYIVPYVEYETQPSTVEEITVAPFLQADISKKNLSEMLRQRGYYCVNVNTSTIPIRF